jgi:hypothetical protein
MAAPPPFPWTTTDDDWFAALVSGGRTHGLARRRHDGDLIHYEVLVPKTGQWIFTPEGAGYFTGIGGVTNAVPITPAEATDVERSLLDAVRAAEGAADA